jgi:hypothetical protein
MSEQRKSITVEFWSWVFEKLRFVSFFKIVECVSEKVAKPQNKHQYMYSVVDVWVLFNLFFAFISIFIVKYFDLAYFVYIFIFYGAIRVFEIIVYQINVLLFDQYRSWKKGESYKIRGYRRMVVNLLCNFVEIVFWFSVSYVCFLTNHFTQEHDPSLLQVMLTSFSYTTGFGIHDLLSLPKLSSLGTSILYFQSIAGLVMTLISIARFIALLPPIESVEEHENSNNRNEI